jgi:glycosyltransferase involved in cell wall biosynthesis
MRFHLVGQAQCCTTAAFPLCGFTKKTMAFAAMMHSRGHTVYLYGGAENEAPCTEFIPLVTETERVEVLEWKHYIYPSWAPGHPVRQRYNERLVEAIGQRHQPGDIVCILGGNIHQPLIDAFPHVVEFGVGYSGVAAKYIVWESHCWRAICSTHRKADPDPNHAVIHGFFTVPAVDPMAIRGDYLLFIGRVTQKKGIEEACRAASTAGKRLLVAGYGEKKLVTHGAEYLGPVSEEQRVRLMAGAQALICPTQSYEAFGNISPEAQLCGAPVIATNWGGFLDTVIPGVTGWLCDTPDELVTAIGRLGDLADSATIRQLAIDRFSPDAAYPQYMRYFRRITSGASVVESR